jgi:hypothetical protein
LELQQFVVLNSSSAFETRSLPTLTRSYPRRFTFYVAHPIRSIHCFNCQLFSFSFSGNCKRLDVTPAGFPPLLGQFDGRRRQRGLVNNVPGLGASRRWQCGVLMLNDAGDFIACSERVRTARDHHTGLEADRQPGILARHAS